MNQDSCSWEVNVIDSCHLKKLSVALLLLPRLALSSHFSNQRHISGRAENEGRKFWSYGWTDVAEGFIDH